MTIDLYLTIEQIVKEKELSYMDAVLYHALGLEIEPEAMAKMLNQSVKDKIEDEYLSYLKSFEPNYQYMCDY